jgi:colanic acid/amylovoran biosynthesis glycosyltransferase
MPETGGQRATVLIYAEPLLARSMTFVCSQGESLKRFVPYYIGPQYLRDGLTLPEHRTVTICKGNTELSRVGELPFKLFGFAPLFVRRLRKLRPVLLHAHFGPMGLRALPIARSLNIPLVVTFHGYDATVPDEVARKSRYFAHRQYVKRRNQLQKSCRMFLAVSRFVQDQIIRQGFPPDKVKVHYVGVDINLFCPDPEIVRSPIVLFVGRLEEVKGCDYLIRAMGRVQAACPTTRLVIIGDGSQRIALERMAQGAGVDVSFIGFQPPAEVKRWMNQSSIFAAPSVRTSSGSEEGCGLALLEAQAMGLPVVSCDSGGIPEIVTHGETGFLSPERDYEALGQHIMMLVRSKSLTEKMGQAARAKVKRSFNLQNQTRALEALYDEVVSSNDPFPLSRDSGVAQTRSAETTDYVFTNRC